jgi:hypothetical protein
LVPGRTRLLRRSLRESSRRRVGLMRQTDTDFWTTHDGQREATEREKLAARDPLRVEQPIKCAVSVLMAGAVSTTAADSGMAAIVVHAVARDGASLCQRVPAVALLVVDDGLWSSVPGYERCLECSALT